MEHDHTLDAMHEAAHAVLALRAGLDVRVVEIRRGGEHPGIAYVLETPVMVPAFKEQPDGSFVRTGQATMRAALARRLDHHRLVMVAGLAIERLFGGDDLDVRRSSDDLGELRRTYRTQKAFEDAVGNLVERATKRILTNRISIFAVAKLLNRRGSLTGAEIREIMRAPTSVLFQGTIPTQNTRRGLVAAHGAGTRRRR